MSESDADAAPVLQFKLIRRQYLNFISFTSCINLGNFLLGWAFSLHQLESVLVKNPVWEVLLILFLALNYGCSPLA